MKSKTLFLVGLIITIISPLQAQDSIIFKRDQSYKFINQDANIIHNSESLTPFYSRLNELKNKKNSVVNILHIGDSHIQADYMTGTTRTLLQKEFGNAGLGLSFPGRAARTNESPLIYSIAKGDWDSNKITYSQTLSPIGIGGTSVKTNGTGNTIRIKSTLHEYDFNRLTLFFQKDFTSYNVLVKDSTGQLLAVVGAFTEEPYANVSKLIIPFQVNQIQLETNQSLPTQTQFSLFGISLENSNPGVRYHIIGVNGARYRHYLSSQLLLNQTAALNTNLIIISLGTNEAVDHPHMDQKLSSQVTSMVMKLKQVNPDATIIITTPADFFKKRTKRNPGVLTIKNRIIEVANANHLAYWNLHEVAGGNHSADQWKKSGLLQPDGIHFTKKGYELQGQLLFEAIIKGYNEYVFNRSSKTD